MAATRERKDEMIRLNRFDLEGEAMLDIRFWKNTKKGPQPTIRGVAIEQRMITRMIIGLQRVQSIINSEQAREQAEVR